MAPPKKTMITLDLDSYLSKQNLVAHALTAHYDTTKGSLHQLNYQIQILSEVMLQVQTSVRAVLHDNGVVLSPDDIAQSYPAVADLLGKAIATGAESLPGPMPVPMMAPVANGAKPKKRRERKPKDPNAPKLPITAYFLFLEANRERVRQDLGEKATPGEVQKQATREWNDLAENDKAGYKAQYQRNFAEYQKKLDAYKKQGGLVTVEDYKPLDDHAVPPPDLLGVAESAAESEEENENSSERESSSEAAEPPPKKGGRKGKSKEPEKPAKKVTAKEETAKKGAKKGKRGRDDTPEEESPKKKKKGPAPPAEKEERKRRRSEKYGNDF